jgi:hypothetical protein
MGEIVWGVDLEDIARSTDVTLFEEIELFGLGYERVDTDVEFSVMD